MLKRIVMFVLMIGITIIGFSVASVHAEEDCTSDLDYVAIGIDEYNRRDFDSALIHLTCAIDLDADKREAYLYRALTYRELENYDKAMGDIDDALTIDSRYAAAYVVRGSLYFRQGIYLRALENYETGLSIHEQTGEFYLTATVHSTLGETYFYLGYYEKALNHLNMAIEVAPRRAVAYAARGFVYEVLGDLSLAQADWERSLELNPKIADDYFQQGVYRLNVSAIDQAIQLFSQGIQLSPEDARGYYLRGVAYYQQQNYGQSVIELTLALQKQPDFEAAQAARQQSLLDLSVLMVVNPNDPSAYRALGDANYIAGNWEAALRNYEIYLDLVAEDTTIQARVIELQILLFAEQSP